MCCSNELPAVLDELRLQETGNSSTRDIPLFGRYRKLLWFWQEYYMRRGRDRLSLEFSSHILFPTWQAVVALLCRDDGSSCALLSTPIDLPESPYAIKINVVDGVTFE